MMENGTTLIVGKSSTTRPTYVNTIIRMTELSPLNVIISLNEELNGGCLYMSMPLLDWLKELSPLNVIISLNYELNGARLV